jgi:hypothetical protein
MWTASPLLGGDKGVGRGDANHTGLCWGRLFRFSYTN